MDNEDIYTILYIVSEPIKTTIISSPKKKKRKITEASLPTPIEEQAPQQNEQEEEEEQQEEEEITTTLKKKKTTRKKKTEAVVEEEEETPPPASNLTKATVARYNRRADKAVAEKTRKNKESVKVAVNKFATTANPKKAEETETSTFPDEEIDWNAYLQKYVPTLDEDEIMQIIPIISTMPSIAIINVIDYLRSPDDSFDKKLSVLTNSNGEYFTILKHHPDMKNTERSLLMEMRALTEAPEVAEGIYRCNKCRSWKTLSNSKQTRSADEPMTVFITCTECGNKQRD